MNGFISYHIHNIKCRKFDSLIDEYVWKGWECDWNKIIKTKFKEISFLKIFTFGLEEQKLKILGFLLSFT